VEEDRELSELEELAFVPAGECIFWQGLGAGVVCSNSKALVVDRFEVTRGRWRAWIQGRPSRPDPLFEAVILGWGPGTDDWPASFMTLVEAREFAAAKGLRLPTAREWMRIACGTGKRPHEYPWGGSKAVSVANTLELGLRHPLPVGTFEQGRTPLSIYDLSGNVWEWVEEPIRMAWNETTFDMEWVMGGSYLSRLRRLYDYSKLSLAFHQQDLDHGSRSVDVGLRCCADAEPYLWEHARRWKGEQSRERLLAVGAAWGREAVPLLEELARRPGAPEGLAHLLAGARR